MVTKELTVTNPTGLHCRPLGLVVQKAKEYASRVAIRKEERRFDAKVMISLLQGGICQGDKIAVEADGPDENEAAEAVAWLIEHLTE